MATRIAVVYCSSTGYVHRLAEALVEGAEESGAEVRLRRVPELAPAEVIASQDAGASRPAGPRTTSRPTRPPPARAPSRPSRP